MQTMNVNCYLFFTKVIIAIFYVHGSTKIDIQYIFPLKCNLTLLRGGNIYLKSYVYY